MKKDLTGYVETNIVLTHAVTLSKQIGEGGYKYLIRVNDSNSLSDYIIVRYLDGEIKSYIEYNWEKDQAFYGSDTENNILESDLEKLLEEIYFIEQEYGNKMSEYIKAKRVVTSVGGEILFK